MLSSVSEFMIENGIVELEMVTQGQEIRLKRGQAVSSEMVTMRSMEAMTAVASAPAMAPVAPAAAPVVETKSNYHVISSPFVGTFYRAAGPNQDPFVEVGKIVNAGDSLCIIEAMKLMNEIESDAKGRVVRILVQNGTPVEFGEPLFEIEPL